MVKQSTAGIKGQGLVSLTAIDCHVAAEKESDGPEYFCDVLGPWGLDKDTRNLDKARKRKEKMEIKICWTESECKKMEYPLVSANELYCSLSLSIMVFHVSVHKQSFPIRIHLAYILRSPKTEGQLSI